MILKDVLKKASEIIGDKNIDLDAEADTPERERLISSANMIYEELTEEYVHLKYSEVLTVTDGRIYYSEFSKPVKDVMRIRKNGVSVPFELYPLYVKCDAEGAVTVSYVYHAPELTLTSDVELPPQYSESALATGIASEYFYRSGLYDEAVFYKNRYDNTVLNLSRKRNPVVVKYRRFI